MSTPRLDYIAAHGNKPPLTVEGMKNFPHPTGSIIKCADGFRLSVIAGDGTYCTPRPSAFGNLGEVPQTYSGPYTEVEVGFPTAQPTPWHLWSNHAEDPAAPTDTVYAYVPVEKVRALLELHGGEQS